MMCFCLTKNAIFIYENMTLKIQLIFMLSTHKKTLDYAGGNQLNRMYGSIF